MEMSPLSRTYQAVERRGPIMDMKLEPVSDIERNNRYRTLWSWMRLPWGEEYLSCCRPMYRHIVILISWTLFECHGLSCDRLAWVEMPCNSIAAWVNSNGTIQYWKLEKPDTCSYNLEHSPVNKNEIKAYVYNWTKHVFNDAVLLGYVDS
jgi:hypothetical protein